MKQTFRSKTAFVLGWVWVAFAAINLWDLIARYNGKPSLVALAVLGVLTAVIYVLALRPVTKFTGDELVGRNPFRTTLVPWAAIKDVTVSHSINVEYDDSVLRLWTPMSSARERAKSQRKGMPGRRGRFGAKQAMTKEEEIAATAFAGKTHADWVGEQIMSRAESARSRREEQDTGVRTVWAYDSIGVLLAALALVVVAVVAP
ncbi:hypothetical protein HII36_10590 [Nonomuraea sp. NN258]|uniref:hypothetical protein n=1 Tax=Nonomuraea antri TaxID=2730852 RepID=UPI001569D6EA|nr:hypothetical protein [Nonomuraea antri]NRQ32281.1 hypothetical protein [Nonomuraea antri]